MIQKSLLVKLQKSFHPQEDPPSISRSGCCAEIHHGGIEVKNKYMWGNNDRHIHRTITHLCPRQIIHVDVIDSEDILFSSFYTSNSIVCNCGAYDTLLISACFLLAVFFTFKCFLLLLLFACFKYDYTTRPHMKIIGLEWNPIFTCLPLDHTKWWLIVLLFYGLRFVVPPLEQDQRWNQRLP